MLALFGIITLVMLATWPRSASGECSSCGSGVRYPAGGRLSPGVNFATLGYGDIVMSPQWKLLGPWRRSTVP